MCFNARPPIATRIIFFSFWSFVVVMRVIIIFILIRDIKIRGADAAATPKRTQCTRCTRITYNTRIYTHAHYIYTETRIIMVFWWLSPCSAWYVLELPPKKKNLKTQKQQPKNTAVKRNDAYIIIIILRFRDCSVWHTYT